MSFFTSRLGFVSTQLGRDPPPPPSACVPGGTSLGIPEPPRVRKEGQIPSQGRKQGSMPEARLAQRGSVKGGAREPAIWAGFSPGALVLKLTYFFLNFLNKIFMEVKFT